MLLVKVEKRREYGGWSLHDIRLLNFSLRELALRVETYSPCFRHFEDSLCCRRLDCSCWTMNLRIPKFDEKKCSEYLQRSSGSINLKWEKNRKLALLFPNLHHLTPSPWRWWRHTFNLKRGPLMHPTNPAQPNPAPMEAFPPMLCSRFTKQTCSCLGTRKQANWDLLLQCRSGGVSVFVVRFEGGISEFGSGEKCRKCWRIASACWLDLYLPEPGEDRTVKSNVHLRQKKPFKLWNMYKEDMELTEVIELSTRIGLGSHII